MANLTDWQIDAIRHRQSELVRQSSPDAPPSSTFSDNEKLPSVGTFADENVRQGAAWEFLTKIKRIDPDKAEEILRRR